MNTLISLAAAVIGLIVLFYLAIFAVTIIAGILSLPFCLLKKMAQMERDANARSGVL